MGYRWLGHGGLLLPGPPCVVVDPWRWPLRGPAAELVLVTHGRPDHCSVDDLRAAALEGAVAYGPAPALARLRGIFGERARALEPGEVVHAPGIRIEALPAEAPARARGFQPRGTGVAFLVEVGGARHLLLGDSDALPEHEGLAPDVAYLAVGGLTVADAEEAAEAARRIAPKLAVPVHWGDLTERLGAALRFVEGCRKRGVAAEVPGDHGGPGLHSGAP